ncbi:MAG: hypothetical protein LAP61_06085 [Acidobacteriia bacterium]|nr:hypothetical protein [Terriglobia bacterium]
MIRPETAPRDVTLKESPAAANKSRLKLVYGATLGVFLFFLQQVAVISGVLAPPPGYEPAWALRSLDLPQYVTWLAAGRTSFLLPNYHAPWVSEPAAFQPLFLVAGWIPLPPLAAYQVLSLVLYIAAGMALIYAVRVFCPEHPGYALLASACAMPLWLLVLTISKIFHSLLLFGLGLSGIVSYTYNSADGLFRGGLVAAPTLSAGTAFVLLFMAVLAVYVRNRQLREARILMALAFFSAFFHPFEIYVMVAASAIPLWQCGRFKTWIGVAAAGALGTAPYVFASISSEWLRDVGERIRYPMYAFWIPENYGLPFFLLVYLLLIRFRMSRPEDRVLQSWFLATIVLAFIPGISFPSHLFNGFVYCLGFLLVQRVVSDPQLLPVLHRYRRMAISALAGVVLVTGVSFFLVYRQLWSDGRRAEPEWFLTAVRPASERTLLEWLQTHADRRDLVLSPPELAPWVATIPLPSFASHDFFSITYTDQMKLSDAFYRGENMQNDLLAAYGVRFAVVPASSPAVNRLPAEAFRESIGPWRIYEFPDARMKPYPGLAALEPNLQTSPRTKVLQWLARLRARN